MRKSGWIALAAAIFLSCVGQAADDAKDWRVVDPDNLLLIGTKYGEVAVELSPKFAPRHVERMKALVRAHFFDGLNFYRVIDGFVAQGGAGEDTASTANKPKNPADEEAWPKLKREFERRWGKDAKFTPLGSPDLFARQTGHVDGFPVGRDPKAKTEWIIHCPGTFAFARDNDPDTATTEFYIIIGQAPRRLDRDLTAFGRVLSGMQYLQKLERGDPDVDSGVIGDVSKRDPIVKVRLAADLPAAERPTYQVIRTDSKTFADSVEARRHPTSPFYFRKPPPILDICGVPATVKRTGP